MKNDTLKSFALDSKGASVLFSMQSHLIKEDISATYDDEKKKRKERWHRDWINLIKKGFGEDKTKDMPKFLPRASPTIQDIKNKLRGSSDCLQAGLILLEMCVFRCYWPMKDEQKDFKGLSMDKSIKRNFLRKTSKELGFDETKADDLDRKLKQSQRKISGQFQKILIGGTAGALLIGLTGGVAAPYVAAAIGSAAGLSGAAAISYGLALLGGGSIAAGGLGMAGGVAMLTGGGALLGLGMGTASGRYIGVSPEGALLESAKIEVVLEEFVFQHDVDNARLVDVLTAQRELVQDMEKKLDKMKMSSNGSKKDKNEIKKLEKSIKVIQKSLDRNHKKFKV